MYGKKRIVITKQKQIILAGGHSYIPIGKLAKINDINVRLLYPDNYLESKFNQTNSMYLNFLTVKELRKFINELYKEHLTQ